ncbi:MAG: RNase adapter RapZ [Clostridiaceae bacterium]|nr:RNase adapter RapZ [Clostridiaceae bacterium]
MELLIITGMSGAGKSLCVKYFEDIGYFCVDNLPPSLIPKFAEVIMHGKSKLEKVALIIDIRGGAMFLDLLPALSTLTDMGINFKILFLDASDAVLVKRFKESRRMHPLSKDGRLSDGIAEERKILQTIKDKADVTIDTSNLSPQQLREAITNHFVKGKNFSGLIIHIVSFGFKYGIPIDSDLVFDVRFIPNPYYVPELKSRTGLEREVMDYIMNFSETKIFINKLFDMIIFLLPQYVKEGKRQLIIAIGCTGGRHRSVAIADKLYKRLKRRGANVVIQHRDINRDDNANKDNKGGTL